MACINVKEVVNEYGTVEDFVKEICTDRACTLDAILKNLKQRNIEITEPALLSLIARIEGMVVFDKEHKHDIGDIITYRHCYLGIIYVGEALGNTIVRIEYKRFFLYNEKRYKDEAFREHIFSKLEFEELERVPIDSTDILRKALEELKIEKDKWKNYVVVGDERLVFCKKWHMMGGYSTTECLGKLIRRTQSN